METLEEEKRYTEENAMLLEEYSCLQGKSEEEKVHYILSAGGCTFDEFKKEIIDMITQYYNQ